MCPLCAAAILIAGAASVGGLKALAKKGKERGRAGRRGPVSS